MGCHSLLQGIFLSQGLKPGLLHHRPILYRNLKVPLPLLASENNFKSPEGIPAPMDKLIQSYPALSCLLRKGVAASVRRCSFFPLALTFFQFSSVAQSYPAFCDPLNRSMSGLPVHHQLPCPPKTMSTESVLPSNHFILCHPLLLLPSIFPSIRVFSNESALRIRWPKYWSFSFNISLSNEHPGLISFRMDWLNLLAVQGTLKESSPTPQFKSINSSVLSFLHSPTLTSIPDQWKNHSLD